MHKTAQAASNDFSFHFLKRAFNIATKCVAFVTRHGFLVESTASAIMSEKSIALKVYVHYFLMFYIQFLLLPNMLLAIANTF